MCINNVMVYHPICGMQTHNVHYLLVVANTEKPSAVLFPKITTEFNFVLSMIPSW